MKLLLYCVKAKPYITRGNDGSVYPSCVISDGIKEWHLNGKIVAECDFEVEEIACSKIDYNLSYAIDGTGQAFYDNSKEYEPFYLGLNISNIELLRKSCLTNKEIYDYLKGKNGYAIHIKNLKIFDEPRKLYDCLIHPKIESKYYGCEHLSKAPQNMMYVELDDIRHILISIRPEWLCKILNNEKTIEVRKKVLREMIK